jgi:catalase
MSKEMTTDYSVKNTQEQSSAPDKNSLVAAGGELHQIAGGEHPALTTNQGVALPERIRSGNR